MDIKADSLEELILIYRQTPNPITGEKPLFKYFSDDLVWNTAFEAGRRAAQGIAKSSVQQTQAGADAPKLCATLGNIPYCPWVKIENGRNICCAQVICPRPCMVPRTASAC